MQKDRYSAGMVSKPFWYVEFKTIIELLARGYSYDEIKHKTVEENLFGVPKKYRAQEIYNGISRRAKSFDAETIDLFCKTDLTSKKALALIAVLKTDRLFFEFLYEVYREKIRLGLPYIESADLNTFFGNKQAQSEIVASWKEYTIKKLKNSYVNYLADSGLSLREGGSYKITPPVLDTAVREYLSGGDRRQYLRALIGEK